jgi:integrase
MGKKATLSGIRARGSDRIEFDFLFDGVRYRPTVRRIPSEANLRRAYKQLEDIKRRIERGDFNFSDEFPDYRYKTTLVRQGDIQDVSKPETCNEVVDKFLAYCELRVSKDDLAPSTLGDYQDIMGRVIRPTIGHESFDGIIYSRLAEVVSDKTKDVKKKTYNNIVSAVRTYFKFGYKDRPGKFNPALALPGFRITAKDRPKVDPFKIQEAELIIAASHRMHGEWYGNFEEFRFFTALRHSEQFALKVSDCDLVEGKISITKAVVDGQMKNRTKTNQDREINLCPRALQVLRAQLALRERRMAAGQIHHEFVFFTAVGEPLETTYLPYNRWTEVLETLPDVRRRKPYNARHSYSSWRLMTGHNRLLVALEDGHSVETMERTYVTWTKGAKPEDVELIKAAFAGRPSGKDYSVDTSRQRRRRDSKRPLASPEAVTKLSTGTAIEGIKVPDTAIETEDSKALNPCFTEQTASESSEEDMAGVAGFEPTNGGIKTRCLTTWRHPNTKNSRRRRTS